MSQHGAVTRPRGPLPARVYWFRRGLVLGMALLLVGGLVLLVSSFGGGGGDTAVTAAAPASPSASGSGAATPSPTPTTAASAAPTSTATTTATPTPGGASGAAGPLSASKGTCATSDVAVRAAPGKVVGGSAVTIPLVLTTTGDPCTLAVSSRSVVAKITSGDDRIWSSQDCPAGIPTTSVVVRGSDERATKINLTWSGRRSAEGCAGGLAWAQPGSYHVVTAALGGQESDRQFALGTPPRPVVTKTAKPKQQSTTPPSAVATPKG